MHAFAGRERAWGGASGGVSTTQPFSEGEGAGPVHASQQASVGQASRRTDSQLEREWREAGY
eukprot:5129371-Alexandrium_andersonii.AAC.1